MGLRGHARSCRLPHRVVSRRDPNSSGFIWIVLAVAVLIATFVLMVAS